MEDRSGHLFSHLSVLLFSSHNPDHTQLLPGEGDHKGVGTGLILGPVSAPQSPSPWMPE